MAAVSLAAGAALLLIYAVQAFVPPNVLRLPGQEPVTQVLSATIPQGWAFFTRPPREPSLRVLSTSDQGTSPPPRAPIGPNGSAAYGWGVSRQFMLEMTEASALAQTVDSENWIDCESNSVCGDRVADLDPNVFDSDVLPCGSYVFAYTEPAPFAWRETVDDLIRLVRATPVEIRC
ncbi:SdpA family antimicrobial peptide system protein [Microbacterium sp.]|uniref:SdpA family antimicrobial peptide system protein n=1 Tax=Microbacterium sp. TaxID=51671 RepID=UPI00352515DE